MIFRKKHHKMSQPSTRDEQIFYDDSSIYDEGFLRNDPEKDCQKEGDLDLVINREKKEEAIPQPEEEKKGFFHLFLPKKNKKLSPNRYMFFTCFFVVLLFFAMIAYMIHFMIVDRQTVINSPYNMRTQNLTDHVVRGSILSSDQKVLAVTTTDKAGNEKRYYPFGEIFSHVVGYTIHGKAGLESSCNFDLLTSHADIFTQIRNGVVQRKNQGDDIITTLDSQLQEAAYDALGDYDGAIIAIEPKTGKIRAMVSKPDFDPNTLEDMWSDLVTDSANSVLLNRCTQGLYPPGSTYKVIMALEYMNEHEDDFNDFQYNCSGETVVNSVRIHCYENEEHGQVNLEEAFAQSCNTAFVTLGSQLNRRKYISLNEEFLFNSAISCDLSVAKSQFKITMKSDKNQLPQTSIGQGDTLMTPLHNALIMCAIANDGVMMRPTLLEEIKSYDGITIKTYESSSLMELSNKDHLSMLQKMLRKAVTDGTASALSDTSYTVAGKTGSAENEKEKAHSWFVGYSNVEDPDLVVCVIVENAGTGSKYAVPMAKKVFDAYYKLED